MHAQSSSSGSAYVYGGGITNVVGQHDFLTGNGTISLGIIGSERSTSSSYGFLQSASWVNANDNAFIDGYATTYGTSVFIFPIGDNGKYRPAAVSTASLAAPNSAAYFSADPSTAITSNLAGGNETPLPTGAPFSITAKETGVNAVTDKEYWDIKGTTAAQITLTWDVNSTIATLTSNTLTNLTIVGWNGTAWVKIPSTVDATSILGGTSSLTAGSITTNATLTPNTYLVYTLASALVCNAGVVAPILSATTVSNTCPTTTVDLNSYVTSITPNGARLRWHTVSSSPTNADSVATPSVFSTIGTYYAYYFDEINNCYSPATAAVTGTINVCNQSPVITSAAAATTLENVATTTAVYTATAIDPNLGQTQTYSLETGGADNGKFTIDATTGEVKFVASPDFETPTDANGDNIYEIKVKVCDNGTPQYCATKDVGITVTDVVECPTPSLGGTTNNTGGTLCSTANSGIVVLTGKTGNVVKWQTSTNGGVSWTDVVNTTTTLVFTNAANNQQYRTVVNNSGSCVDAYSTTTTIITSVVACSTACDVPITIITGY